MLRAAGDAEDPEWATARPALAGLTGLADMGVDELLAPLLERTRELLSVDTATLLLLDPSGDELVAVATSGFAEEIRQGVRVTVGAGFAGRVAATQQPIIIEDVSRAEVSNPLLKTKGLRSLLGVPVTTEGRLVGVLHVGSFTARTFTSADVDMLHRAAERVGWELDASPSRLDRMAAATLQRSLIPSRLPAVPGLELAGRYLAGEAGGFGGDWYDVFALPSGRVALVIGDVVGRGLPAAVVMGRLRSALRAYALETFDPADVLERLDRKVQHFEAGQMTTVLCAVLDPTHAALELSLAGHLPPMLALPDGSSRPVDAPVDAPLGVAPGVRRRTTRADVPPGAVLALFTDGLVERRGTSLPERLEQLRTALRAEPAETCCNNVIADLVGSEDLHDDVALLVMRRTPLQSMPDLDLEVPAVPAALAHLRAALRLWLTQFDLPDGRVHDIVLAVGEASANAVEHASGPTGGQLRLQAQHASETIVATVTDGGSWRAPRGTNRGRGTNIMEHCADDIAVERAGDGTAVRLAFHLEKSNA